MAKLNLYHSPRCGKQGTAPIMIQVSHKSKTAYLPTNISVMPDEFVDGKVVNRKDAKMLNTNLTALLFQVNANLLHITNTIPIGRLDVKKLRDMIAPTYDAEEEKRKEEESHSFYNVYKQFTETHNKPRTIEAYERTLKAIEEYDPLIAEKSFNQLDKQWFDGFRKERLQRENVNTYCGMHLCHIRAAFNYAIDELDMEIKYPFSRSSSGNTKKKVKMESQPSQITPMPLADLLYMWTAELEPWQERWVDLAKLVFMLIGINMVDLAELTTISADDYIDYRRRKTRDRSKSGACYHIKVQPEAMEIINKWRGVEHLLSHFDGRANHNSASKSMVHAVKCIDLPKNIGGQGKKAEVSRQSKKEVTDASRFGYFCLYSLRKAWATIAFNECGIPMEVISMALGHSQGKGLSVTQRYVYFNNKLVDAANRKVLDFIAQKIREH